MLLYPLSGFLTLFANILQNPQDSQVVSDLKLMDLVTSYFSPQVVQVSQLSATAGLIFRELGNVAAEFAKKTHSDNAGKKKRVHDKPDRRQDVSHSLPNGSHTIDSLPHSNINPEAPESMVCISFRHSFQTPRFMKYNAVYCL
jgi:hypothetical protein